MSGGSCRKVNTTKQSLQERFVFELVECYAKLTCFGSVTERLWLM